MMARPCGRAQQASDPGDPTLLSALFTRWLAILDQRARFDLATIAVVVAFVVA
jgi:hypothetical protein